ncbi:MAG: hypothetical protein ABI461_03280 [Polyangiaceae bacterium]
MKRRFDLRVLRTVLFFVALGVLFAAPAYAQDAPTPPTPATLPKRQANFAWDKTLLRASFSYRDALTQPIIDKLSNGLPTVIAMRAYVVREGETTPVALAVRSCRVVYDLWDEVYRIRVTSPGGERDLAVINVEGVMRQCADARDLPVADKALLKSGVPHFLAVIVDVNPVSAEMLKQMRSWVSRPTGSTGIGPSDALFGSFVGLFVRSIGTSDNTVPFRTQSFTP